MSSSLSDSSVEDLERSSFDAVVVVVIDNVPDDVVTVAVCGTATKSELSELLLSDDGGRGLLSSICWRCIRFCSAICSDSENDFSSPAKNEIFVN